MILWFCFTMVLNHYFTSFHLLPWPINYNHAYLCTQSSTHSSPSWIWLKIFSFPWIDGVVHDYVLWALNYTNEQIITMRVIFKFDIDPTPLWWKSRTCERCALLKSNPFKLGIIEFFQTLIHWWFCCRLTSFLMMNLKLL